MGKIDLTADDARKMMKQSIPNVERRRHSAKYWVVVCIHLVSITTLCVSCSHTIFIWNVRDIIGLIFVVLFFSIIGFVLFINQIKNKK